MNTRQSMRLMAAAAAAANGGKNGSAEEPGMRIGEDYQAVVPDLVQSDTDSSDEVTDEQSTRSSPLVLWKPAPLVVSDHDLDEYLRYAESSHEYSIEQALGMLYWHNYDVKKAMNDMPNFRAFKEEWSIEEKVVFERAFHMHGKNFHRIKSFLPNKSINSLVRHYYTHWKRSYLQVSLLDIRAQEQQKKDSGQLNASGTADNNGSGAPGNGDSTVTPVDGMPASTLKGKQLPKGIFLSVNDFIAAFDDPQNKKIKRLEMQILEYKQQIQQNKQLLDGSTDELVAQETVEQLRPPSPSNKPRSGMKWSPEEIARARKGFQTYGRNFEAVADMVETKTAQQCKNFFFNYKRRLSLPKLISENENGNEEAHTEAGDQTD